VIGIAMLYGAQQRRPSTSGPIIGELSVEKSKAGIAVAVKLKSVSVQCRQKELSLYGMRSVF